MPGTLSIITGMEFASPQLLNIFSAESLLLARSASGAAGLSSLTHSPLQLPYTPVVLIITTLSGREGWSRDDRKASILKSTIPSEGGGAK